MTTRSQPVRSISLAGAIREAYAAGQEDEALEPIVRASPGGRPRGRLRRDDSVIFYDIRGEREVELTESLIHEEFDRFPRKDNLRLHFVTMITYDPSLAVHVAFPSQGKIRNTLVEVLCRNGLRVAKISESEKAVHIGFFLNGKSNRVFAGERRFVIPSPQGTASYALTPEMSAAGVTEEIIVRLKDPAYPVVMANLANVDVVGHIEDRAAVQRAVEAVDRALGRVVSECRKRGITLVVTADHGTVEEWLYPEGGVNTGHTRNPVPFILADYAASAKPKRDLRQEGELADVAPTVLDLAGIVPPAEMTGQSLMTGPPGRMPTRKKIALLILDGWGLRDEPFGNLIRQARTPYFNKLWSEFPHSALKASGEAVGMPVHAVGNSEAGHLHLGAGRRVLLDRVRIDRAIEDRSFFANPAFLGAMKQARNRGKALHLLGIISHYSSHGTIRHLFALLKMAKEQNLRKVFIHGFIGRRGEKPESGAVYVEKVEQEAARLGLGEVVTVMGRHWSLDREENWDRIEKAYRALVMGTGMRVTGLPGRK
jgi:2,3-bisphosphoglycerate-independent phosphoglycerate mutase